MKLGLLRNRNLWLSDPERRSAVPAWWGWGGALMPWSGGRSPRGLVFGPRPPLLPPCCVQTLRHEFFWVSSHYPFPPSRVKIAIILKHRKLPFCCSKTAEYWQFSYSLTLLMLIAGYILGIVTIWEGNSCYLYVLVADYSVRRKVLLYSLPEEF